MLFFIAPKCQNNPFSVLMKDLRQVNYLNISPIWNSTYVEFSALLVLIRRCVQLGSSIGTGLMEHLIKLYRMKGPKTTQQLGQFPWAATCRTSIQPYRLQRNMWFTICADATYHFIRTLIQLKYVALNSHTTSVLHSNVCTANDLLFAQLCPMRHVTQREIFGKPFGIRPISEYELLRNQHLHVALAVM